MASDGYIITPDLFKEKFKILIYGDPGAGKTYLAGTAQDHPNMANVHVLNIDGGMLTLADRGDIGATDVRSSIELENEMYKIASNDPKYKDVKTVVIDNISELQTIDLENTTSNDLKDRLKRNKDYTIDEIYLEDYGISSKRIARILRGFRDLPVNVIYIAHRKDKKRRNSDVIEESKPNLTEKLCTAVMGYMDFVWYLYTADIPINVESGEQINETHRFILTQPYNGFVCKTRGTKFAKALGVVVQDPTFPEIMNLHEKCR